jgi:K+-sensing histidine kinase KdpD
VGEGGARDDGWLTAQRELARLMAHDLRNPVASILANLNFLELALPHDSSDALDAIADIRAAAEILLRVIDNQVTIATLEAGNTPVEPHPVAVADAVQAAFDRIAPAVRAAGVDLSLELRAGTAAILGDGALLEQLVENLLGNAGQHVCQGQRARLAVEATPTEVVLRLDDDGPALGPVERDFSREGQLELKKRSDARYSRGLALYLVGLAVRAMEGTLATRDDDGRGHVEIRFPRYAL